MIFKKYMIFLMQNMWLHLQVEGLYWKARVFQETHNTYIRTHVRTQGTIKTR